MTTKKSYGYAGQILRVDLSKEKIWTSKIRRYARRFIGGRGVNQWILFDELSPGVSWSNPQNLLVYGVGVLVGTPVPGACRVSIDTKNAFNNGVGSANAGGHFGPELKFAGFDHVVISGRAKRPSYLWIRDGGAEIRNASSLWGKTTWETERIIRRDHGDERVRVSCIGPAGESLVRASSIINDRAKAAGGSGVGAVMGSKRLKALAVRGGRPVEIAEPKGFMEAVKRSWSKVEAAPGVKELREKGFYCSSSGPRSRLWEIGYRPVRNGQDDYWDPERVERISGEAMKRYVRRTLSCFSCIASCMPWVEIGEGSYAGTRGEGFWNNSSNSFCTKFDNDNLEAAIYAHLLSNQLGLDTDNAATVIAWAFECYERGLLTREDTGGLELTWGNHEAMVSMLEKLAYREGIGDFLADGVKRASERLGKGSETFAVHIKGQDSLDGIRVSKGWALGVVTAPCGGRHLRGAASAEPVNSYEGVPLRVFLREQFKAILDMVGVCSYIPNQTPEDLAEMVSAATGFELSADRLMRVGLQVHNVEKAFNTLHTGFTRGDDLPPYRYYNEPVKSGPFKGESLSHERWEMMLDEYYALHGWDRVTSWQTRECLEELDLADVAGRLEEAGRLKTLSEDERERFLASRKETARFPYRWF